MNTYVNSVAKDIKKLNSDTLFSPNSLQANFLQPIFCGIIMFLFFVFSLQLGAAAKVQFCPDISVYSEVNDYEYYRINSYFIQTAYLFNRMYGLEFPKCTLEVIIDDKASSNVVKNGKDPVNLVATTNQKVLFTGIRNFERSLIKAFLLAEISIPVDKCRDSDIEWVISGSLREINCQRDPALLCPYFPIVNQVIRSKGKLNYQKIITLDVAEKGILYDYFAEESQILIDAVLKKKRGREFLFEYVKTLQSSDKYDKEKLFEEFLKKYHSAFGLPEEEISSSFNEYLNNTAAELALNPKNHIACDKIVEKYLYETERKKSNIGRKYYLYLQELERQNDPIARAWPELQKFLDENYPIDMKN